MTKDYLMFTAGLQLLVGFARTGFLGCFPCFEKLESVTNAVMCPVLASFMIQAAPASEMCHIRTHLLKSLARAAHKTAALNDSG